MWSYPPDPRWLVDAVPDDARIAPMRIGPLTLLGVRASPKLFKRRRMLWVETFWRADALVAEDVLLDIRGVPVVPTTMKAWGTGMAHDPCDWTLPTSRWRPGQIYRDRYGLRPPYMKGWANIDLEITIGVQARTMIAIPYVWPQRITLDAPNAGLCAEAAAAPAGAARTRRYRTDFPSIVRDCAPGRTWTAEQLEAATGGTWIVKPPPGWFVRSVIRGSGHVDLVEAPVLYVASDFATLAYHEQFTSPGRSWDTHRILRRGVERFAGAIVARPLDGLPPDFPLLLVDDPVRALIELGLAARQRYDGDVIAITGTAGKSTTVGMLSHLLSAANPGAKAPLASFANYNSRVGAPALLANLSPDHPAAVVEVAQSALWMQRGPVTRLIRPTVAVITEIGISQARSNRVASVEDTAKWKSRLFDGLCGPAVAVFGEHIACFDQVMAAARSHAKRVVTFGDSPAATLRVIERSTDGEGSRIVFRTPEQAEIVLHVPLPGAGMAHNALAAFGVLYGLGCDLAAAAQAMAGFVPEEGRLRRCVMRARLGGEVAVIDDSWNATVSSMLNALSVLAAADAPGGRKIAVLGRIVHLGDLSQALHESVADAVVAVAPDCVVTHGDEMRFLRAKLPQSLLGPHFSSAAALADYLHAELRAGDLVLVKGSRRDSDFGETCQRLIELAERAGDQAQAAG